MGPPTNVHEEPRRRHAWVGLVSLVVAIVLLAVKFWAYVATGSQAVFSDALESIVNVIAAAAAFGVLTWADQPADRDHPFGHGKAEFLSAAFEGGLIVFAGIVILWQSGLKLAYGADVQRVDFGLLLTVLAGLANGGFGVWLVRYGKTHHSTAIEADGHHLLSDFWTSAGVVAGLLAVKMTGLTWLDPLAAALMAVWLLVTGFKLVRRAAGGLLDEGDPALLQRLVDGLAPRVRNGAIRVHHLRALRSGRFHNISAHLVVPEFWSVERAHDKAHELAAQALRELRIEGNIDFHIEPCERAYCSTCDLESCTVRQQPFVGLKPLTLQEVVQTDEEVHDTR